MKCGRSITINLDGEVETIETVASAVDFLQRWPLERRGHVYRSALSACAAAITAQISEADAFKAFTGFARVTGILVSTTEPMVLDARPIQSRQPKTGRTIPK